MYIEYFFFFLVDDLHFVVDDTDTDTYIHWSLQTSVRIIDLVSHTTYVVCVNFIHKMIQILAPILALSPISPVLTNARS